MPVPGWKTLASDTQHDRHRGDHFEIDNGFGADPA
jgi:hypothetical protein